MAADALSIVQEADTLPALEEARIRLLGKKGEITEKLKSVASLPVEERKTEGAKIHQLKQQVESAIAERKAALESAAINEKLAKEKLDITLPIREEREGRIHPISQVMEEITGIFARMGFGVAEGPDIEDDYHNFTALNFPEGHPARDMHDTFYFKPNEKGERLLLRTHTSPVQIRSMQSGKPPFRLIMPGTTYRCDSDMTHTPMFHQVEGLVIDKTTHMGHLKGCLTSFVESFFGLSDVPLRFRPSFFPFTEPSAEVDIGCSRKDGELILGKGNDWLEILGCGMVHPNVLKNCNLDPNEWQGFAFGMGVERLAMLKYGIPDLRMFYESDLRWLKHYGFRVFA